MSDVMRMRHYAEARILVEQIRGSTAVASVLIYTVIQQDS